MKNTRIKNPISLTPESMILNSLNYHEYINSKRSNKESIFLFYFKLMNVINVYKPQDVWPSIKYTKMLTTTTKNLCLIRVRQNQNQHWRSLGKFSGHMAGSQEHML